MTVAECKRRMSQKEFVQWQAYYRIEPFGVLQERLGFAYICCLIANYLRGKDAKYFEPGDWFPELDSGKPKANWDDTENQILIAKMWVVNHGGRIIEGKTDGEKRGAGQH